MEIVTGSTGEAHVTPIDDAVRNSNTGYVNDKVVFTYFENLAAQAITANEVRVFSGYGMNQGRYFKIDRNDYDSVTIENGSQGVKRADLIVARYTMDTQTGFEDISLAVIRGQSGSTYVDPSYTTGDINGGDDLDDFPLYRVKINGIVIEAVEALFTPLPDGGRIGFIEQKIDNHLANTTDPHTIAWTEAATLAAISASETLKVQFGKIAKAITTLIAHIGNTNNPHSVSGSQLTEPVPIEKGGTGASTALEALANLGVPSNVADSMPKTTYDPDGDGIIAEAQGGIGDRGVNATDGGVNGSRAVTTAGALYNTKVALQTAFQAGVDAIFNAVKNAGVTPSSSTPSAIATAIGNLRKTPYTATYKPTTRANKIDMGIPHSNRYVDTTAVPNTNSGTYTPTTRAAALDMGATNTNRYVNTTNVPNTNSGSYSFPSSDAGGTKDLGATNTVRYVNAQNVYTTGVNAADARINTNSASYTAGRNQGRLDERMDTVRLHFTSGSGGTRYDLEVYVWDTTAQAYVPKTVLRGMSVDENRSIYYNYTNGFRLY